MAFRRTFRPRFRRFRRRKPVARVRRSWITSLVPTICQPLIVPLPACVGENQFPTGMARIVLVDNNVLQSSFSDRAVVKRIVGDFWFIPTYDGTDPSDCNDAFAAAGNLFIQAFAGLRKVNVNNNGESLTVTPLVSDFDFSESEWLKTWQHLWAPKAELIYVGAHDVKSCSSAICPDVETTGLLDNTFTDGTGTINIETDCGDPIITECTSTQDPRCDGKVTFPPPWHLHLDIRKSIPMRENEHLGLELEFGYSNIATLVNPHIEVVGGVKCLLQY